MVGADEAGERLLGEMAEVGFNLRYVVWQVANARPARADYPDGRGPRDQNDRPARPVDAGWIGRAEAEFARFAGAGIALALPEVPLDARRKLLALGTTHSFLRVASFTTAEILGAGRRLAGRRPAGAESG